MERSGANKLLEKLRHGDELVVWRLDSLGRLIRHLIELINNFHDKGVVSQYTKLGFVIQCKLIGLVDNLGRKIF